MLEATSFYKTNRLTALKLMNSSGLLYNALSTCDELLVMLKMISDLKAIFFDLDNVLVFSERMHFHSWQLVIKKIGLTSDALDFHSMMGVSDLKQAQQIKEKHELTIEVIELWNLKRSTFLELIAQGFESPIGRNAFLEKISTRYATVLVSSSGKHIIQQVLAVENITHYFDFILGHEDCLRHKPDPLPYEQALALVNVHPHEALVIEDSPSGILAAQRAHIPVVGIFKDQAPEHIIEGITYYNSFSEIDYWLEQQNNVKQHVV